MCIRDRCCATARRPPLLRSRQRPASAASGMGLLHRLSFKRCTCSDGYHDVEDKLRCWRRNKDKIFQASCFRKVSNDGTTIIQKLCGHEQKIFRRSCRIYSSVTSSHRVWFLGLSWCHPDKFLSSVALQWRLWSWHCQLKNHSTEFKRLPQLNLQLVLFRWLALLPTNSSTQVNGEICKSMKNWLKNRKKEK